MSKKLIEDCITQSLETYFRDLKGTEPHDVYELVLRSVEKPMLQVVMSHAGDNQSQAAEWLGINRNTLRKKLSQHRLIK
jgi:Fis family transcriptional regulator, factor for inversion stimulation protein